MPLNKLENFVKNTEGRILYVNPSDLDATDAITNQGNSLTQPFKTIQRALLESARFSYLKGNDNDIVEKTTILVYPGEHFVDNRPGYGVRDVGGVAKAVTPAGDDTQNAQNILSLTLDSNFDLNQENNDLYKFNSIHGGVIIPRGTSIVGMDLRKTKIRPKYVPNPTASDSAAPPTALFRVTGSCYFFQFTFFDGSEDSLVYTDKSDFSSNNQAKPTFSHHKLTCFEYADGVTIPQRFDISDLDQYYSKLSNAFNLASTRDIDQKFPSASGGFSKQRPEWEIVGAFATDPIQISNIKSGDGFTPGTVVTVTATADHNLNAGTPIKVKGVDTLDYNISTIVQSVVSATEFTYLLPFVRDNLPPQPTVSAASVEIETDTVSGASPYIFNCSLRSVWGMNGMKADGHKASGFRSMVVAQFTGVSLQKDDRAFVKYNKSSRQYDNIAIQVVKGSALSQGASSLNPDTVYHSDPNAIYRSGWETSHIKITNDAVLQIVSVFAIGYNKHFDIQSGSDASITNSNSNFGQISLSAEGFKNKAFTKDDNAFVTNIITPKAITKTDQAVDWIAIDVAKTRSTGVGISSHLYLYGYDDKDDAPPATLRGYRIGAKNDEVVSVSIDGTVYQAPVHMLDVDMNSATVAIGTDTSQKSYKVTSGPTNNEFTIGAVGGHTIQTGESVRIYSDIGDLPENLEDETTYYAIRLGNGTGIKLASSKTNADNSKDLTVYGGSDLYITSRVHDKESGDLGSPIQWDSANNNWFVHVGTNSNLYTKINTLPAVDVKTEVSYLTRKEDGRSLDDKIYKMRVVVPKESFNARNPNEGFVIQDSSFTGAKATTDFTDNTIDASDYAYKRNHRFISTCTESSNVVTVQTALPHNLKANDLVKIVNVKSTNNTIGAGNSGYNSTFKVTTTADNKTFTYSTTDIVGVTHDPGTFTSDVTTRDLALPRFERNDIQSNYYVYRTEVISEYEYNVQDGVYHLFVLKADQGVSEEFTELKYGQNVTDLYPQQDKDNPDDNPNAAVSYAKRDPLGEVVTNDLKKSITRECVDQFLTDFAVGKKISAVGRDNTAGISTITFTENHNFNGIATGTVTAGANYDNGTYQDVKLLSGGANPATNAWNGSTARVVVAGGGISNVEIIDPGSGYNASVTTPLYFDQTKVGGGNGAARYTISGEQIISNVGDGLEITGIGTTASGQYRITDVPAKNKVAIAHAAADPVIIVGQYAANTGPAGSIGVTQFDATTGISTFWGSGGVAAHGLVSGSKVRLLNSSNVSLGDFYVKEKVSASNFSVKTDTNITPARYIPHGMSAADAISDAGNESVGARGFSFYQGSTYDLGAALGSGNKIVINDIPTAADKINLRSKFSLGSLLQIDNEIVRVVSNNLSGSGNNEITVIRGYLGTTRTNHVNKTKIKKIDPLAVEFRRPSIIRASGHTFEYLGYGPGNYSTGLPQIQTTTLSEREEFLVQAQERSCGAVVYTGMNNRGDFFIGNKRVSSATGTEQTYDAPLPTVTGQDPSKLSVIFDEVVIKDRLIVEGGTSDKILSQFDGPVTFNSEVRLNGTTVMNSTLKIAGTEQSNNINEGCLVLKGGLGVAKNVNIGGDLNVAGIATFNQIGGGNGATFGNIQVGLTGANELDTSTGNLTIDSAGGTTTVDDILESNGQLRAKATTNSSSKTTGSLVVSGGVGINNDLYVGGDITAFSSSDERLKDNITVIPNALDKVKSISGNTFTWNDKNYEHLRGQTDTGVIAQEVEKLGLPGVTQTRDLSEAEGYDPSLGNELKAVDYKRLVPLLIEAIKELSAKVDALS